MAQGALGAPLLPLFGKIGPPPLEVFATVAPGTIVAQGRAIMEFSGHEKTPTLTRNGRIAVVALLILGGGFGVMKATVALGRKAGESTAKRPVPDVEFVTARAGDVPVTLESQGMVQAVTETRAAAEVPGLIVKVAPAWKAGGTFAAGEELLKIDDADYHAALANAEAVAAEADLAVKMEDERGKQAVRDWNKLAAGKPDSDLVTRGPQLAAARARHAAAQAAVEKARRDLDRTVLRAPYAGRIRATMSDLGSYAAPAAPLAEFYSTEAYQVSLPLSLDDFHLLPPGEKEPVKLTAGPGERMTFTGRIVRTSAEIDRASRTIHVTAEIRPDSQAPALLVPGLFVKATLTGVTLKNVIRLPRICLLPDNRVAVITEASKLVTRPVTVERATRNEVMISKGLSAGEKVLSSALAVLTEGMEVHPLNSSNPAQADAAPPAPARKPAP